MTKGCPINPILGGYLEGNVVTNFGVPNGLGSSLNGCIDFVIVRCREDAQIVRSVNRRSVLRSQIADGCRVSSDGSLLHVVASFRAHSEPFVAQDGIDRGGGTLEEIDKGATVEVWLLEMQIRLGAVLLGGRMVRGSQLGLQSFRDGVLEFDLGVKGVGRCPTLG